MARTKVTVLVDWKDNAGPLDMLFGNIDLHNIEQDPLFAMVQAQGTELHFLKYGCGIRLDFKTKTQRDQWVTLAAIKYGLQ